MLLFTHTVRGPLHAVVEAAVHDVLLAGPGHSSVELFTWRHGDLAAHSAKPAKRNMSEKHNRYHTLSTEIRIRLLCYLLSRLSCTDCSKW